VQSNVLVTNDTASFTTDAVMSTLQSVSFYTGTGSAMGQYVTPIFDSGNPSTQWFLYEHAEAYFPNGSSTTSLSAATGNSLTNTLVAGGATSTVTRGPIPYLINANPDSTSNNGALSYSALNNPTTTALTFNGVTLPTTGERRTDASLLQTATGQYCQLTIQLVVNTQGQTAWARSFALYSWIPTAAGDAMFFGKLGMPPNWVPGPLMQAYFGSLVSFVADILSIINDQLSNYGYSTATGAALLQKGLDLNEPHYTGEPTSAYQNRLLTFLQAKSLPTPITGIVTSGVGTLAAPLVIIGARYVTITPVAGEQGSIPFICQQIAQFVNGVSPTLTATFASSTGLLSVSGGGVTVSQSTGRGISISLPNPPYMGLPGLAYGDYGSAPPIYRPSYAGLLALTLPIPGGSGGGGDNPAKQIIKQFVLSLIPAGTLFNVSSSAYLNFNSLG
jgi:hypothetical protein